MVRKEGKKLNALEMELLYNMVCSGYAQTTNSSNTLNGKEELFISSQTRPLGAEMAGLGISVDVLLFTACKREAELIGRACIHAFSLSSSLYPLFSGVKLSFGAVPAVLVEMAEESGHVLVWNQLQIKWLCLTLCHTGISSSCKVAGKRKTEEWNLSKN